jgi:general secretion pathway protein G
MKMFTRLARSQKGLTLVEIIVVLIILAILMSFLGGRILGAGDRAKKQITELKMKSLTSFIEQYQLRYNKLPSSVDSLFRCTNETGPDCIPLTNEDSMKDGWGRDFTYAIESSGNSYKIQSLGSDGRPGGSDFDYDMTVTGP